MLSSCCVGIECCVVLLQVTDTTTFTDEKRRAEVDAWLYETCTQCLQHMIDITVQFYSVVEPLVTRILDLLLNFIRQVAAWVAPLRQGCTKRLVVDQARICSNTWECLAGQSTLVLQQPTVILHEHRSKTAGRLQEITAALVDSICLLSAFIPLSGKVCSLLSACQQQATQTLRWGSCIFTQCPPINTAAHDWAALVWGVPALHSCTAGCS